MKRDEDAERQYNEGKSNVHLNMEILQLEFYRRISSTRSHNS